MMEWGEGDGGGVPPGFDAVTGRVLWSVHNPQGRLPACLLWSCLSFPLLCIITGLN